MIWLLMVLFAWASALDTPTWTTLLKQSNNRNRELAVYLPDGLTLNHANNKVMLVVDANGHNYTSIEINSSSFGFVQLRDFGTSLTYLDALGYGTMTVVKDVMMIRQDTGPNASFQFVAHALMASFTVKRFKLGNKAQIHYSPLSGGIQEDKDANHWIIMDESGCKGFDWHYLQKSNVFRLIVQNNTIKFYLNSGKFTGNGSRYFKPSKASNAKEQIWTTQDELHQINFTRTEFRYSNKGKIMLKIQQQINIVEYYPYADKFTMAAGWLADGTGFFAKCHIWTLTMEPVSAQVRFTNDADDSLALTLDANHRAVLKNSAARLIVGNEP